MTQVMKKKAKKGMSLHKYVATGGKASNYSKVNKNK